MKVTTKQIYHCEPQDYFLTLFDESKRAPWELERGCLEYKVLEHRNDGGQHFLQAELYEPMNAPAAIRKVFGDKTRVIEETSWTEGTDRASVKYIPNKRVNMSGTITATPAGEGRCEVTLSVDVEVKIFGIGKLAEKFVAKEVPEGQARAAQAFNDRVSRGA